MAEQDLRNTSFYKELLQTASLAEQYVWEGAVLTLSRR